MLNSTRRSASSDPKTLPALELALAERGGDAFPAPTEFTTEGLQESAEREDKERAEAHDDSTESGCYDQPTRVNARLDFR
jgi:hypothetical protein